LSKNGLWVLKKALWFILWTLKLAMKILLRWALAKMLSYFFWFATGFYCCGVCRSRKKANKVTEVEKNGKDKAGEKSNGATQKKATAEELTHLLETSKKKDKLDLAVKLLVSLAGTGKPINGKNFPDTVQGKLLEKDVLKKALGRFKEVDLKKLKL